MNNLLKTEDNGIEFYTDALTGESGLSLSGLARLCGVEHSTVSRLLKRQFETGLENLQETVHSSFVLVQNLEAQVDGVDAGNLKVYNAKLCVAVIRHYALKGKKEAVYSLTKFAEMGFNGWIQDINGWQKPAQSTIAPAVNRATLPAEINSADDLPGDLRAANQREMFWATRPGSLTHESCQAIARMFRTPQSPAPPDLTHMAEALQKAVRRSRN